ncbi:MAG: ribosome biogenesis GTPase Der [Coriobacteriia bacterium]
MSLPLVAVVGRPNVGKSTLVNRIVESQDAIVHPAAGVTRDRSYHKGEWNGREFMLVDTGGIDMGTADAFGSSITAQALTAAREADVVVFVVDGRTGVQASDEDVARILKREGAKVILAVNMMDDPAADEAVHSFWSLGVGQPYAISALHGHGTGDLLDEIVALLPEAQAGEDETDISVAIVGRPNVGKSTIFNKLLGFERTIVSDVPGTTRDAIDTILTRGDTTFRLVDTAGLRKKGKIDEDVEYYSLVRALRALDSADVALLVVDVSDGVTSQDQRVARMAAERGCAVVILLNKWDKLDDDDARAAVESQLPAKLGFLSFAPVLRTSGLTGRGMGRVLSAVERVFASYDTRIATSVLNRYLTSIRQEGHTVTRQRRTLRLKYVTQTGVRPPAFTFFCNDPSMVDPSYERYLENRLREHFDLEGTPLVLRFRRRDDKREGRR